MMHIGSHVGNSMDSAIAFGMPYYSIECRHPLYFYQACALYVRALVLGQVDQEFIEWWQGISLVFFCCCVVYSYNFLG